MASAFEMPEDKRDNRRQRLLLKAEMIDSISTRKVHLLNISGTGAKIDADEVPMRDEKVVLLCNGVSIPARVAWVDETRFGIAFDMPIDTADLLKRGQSHRAD
ncbi:MAG TPA: PilZ domain-containing protein [Sphingomonas sp.]